MEFKGTIEEARKLIAEGKFHAEHIWGYTLLRVAIEKENTDVVKLLLDEGAYVNAKDNEWGYTLFRVAITKGNTEAVKLLIDAGADVNAKDTVMGNTPLHTAVQSGQKGIIKVLIEEGAYADVTNKFGKTPRGEVEGDERAETYDIAIKEVKDAGKEIKYAKTEMTTTPTKSATDDKKGAAAEAPAPAPEAPATEGKKVAETDDKEVAGKEGPTGKRAPAGKKVTDEKRQITKRELKDYLIKEYFEKGKNIVDFYQDMIELHGGKKAIEKIEIIQSVIIEAGREYGLKLADAIMGATDMKDLKSKSDAVKTFCERFKDGTVRYREFETRVKLVDSTMDSIKE